MKAQDVVEQLIGGCDGWDQPDTMAFNFYKPRNFPTADSAFVDFAKGKVVIQYIGAGELPDEQFREEVYAIKATLEPYEAPDKEEP